MDRDILVIYFFFTFDFKFADLPKKLRNFILKFLDNNLANNPSRGGAVALGGRSHHHVLLSIGRGTVHVGGYGYALVLRP